MTRKARFSKWLVARMDELEVSQADVARYLGVSNYIVSAWMRERYAPSSKNKQLLAVGLGVTVQGINRLLNGKGECVESSRGPAIVRWLAKPTIEKAAVCSCGTSFLATRLNLKKCDRCLRVSSPGHRRRWHRAFLLRLAAVDGTSAPHELDEIKNAAHAVRWARRWVRHLDAMSYSKWHWTENGLLTLCGFSIPSGREASRSECYAGQGIVDCERCKHTLKIKEDK